MQNTNNRVKIILELIDSARWINMESNKKQ